MVPSGTAQSDRHFSAPDFVADWYREIPVDPFFGPIFKGAAALVGAPVDRHGRLVTGATSQSTGGTFITLYVAFSTAEGRAMRTVSACQTDSAGAKARIGADGTLS
jgi:hypothetical protein